jgi:hypothetical protein
MIAVFDRAKKVHALDRAATVIGYATTLLYIRVNTVPVITKAKNIFDY